ncbi:MAG: hypothetical protein CL868_20220 [Cytophagaceae bacterium]|nr:hypothetical protein [Cytophagaceae bacterium]
MFFAVIIMHYVGYSQHENNCSPSILEQKIVEVNTAIDALHFDIAISKSEELIHMADVCNCNKYLFYGYNLLGENHIRLGDTLKAIQYAEKAVEVAKKIKNDTLLAIGYTSMATALPDNRSSKREALKLYKKTLDIYQKNNTGKFLKPALKMASIYKDLGLYAKMKSYIDLAQKSLENDPSTASEYRITLEILQGEYYDAVGNQGKAAEYYNMAYRHTENQDMPHFILSFYESYANFLNKNDNAEKAYEVQRKYDDNFKQIEQIAQKESVQLAIAKSDAEEFKRQRNAANIKANVASANLQQKKTEEILLWILIGLSAIFLIYFYISTRTRIKYMRDLKKKNKELTCAKAKLEETALTKSRFFSTLSHEMRTPLYSVTGIAGLLEKDNDFTMKYAEEINSLKFSSNHLLDIISDLLDVSKLDDENFKLINRPFNLKILMSEILSSFDKYAYRGKTKLHLDIHNELPNYILGDSRRLSQIIINIVGNALKFTNDGDIWVHLDGEVIKPKQYRITFAIQDTGIGIPPEAQKRIFEEFSQVEEGKPKSTKGTGLGLAIVKKLLEKMDSAIQVESVVGEGSTFSFSIDFNEATLQDVINHEDPKQVAKSLASEKSIRNASILIVDDNKINRLVTKKILTGLEVIVTEAANGEDAIIKAHNESYDLILMDINMPGLNGFETTKIIRKSNPIVPIIALTATSLGEITETIEESGMNGFVIKPYSMKEFVQTIVSHLDKTNTTLSI